MFQAYTLPADVSGFIAVNLLSFMHECLFYANKAVLLLVIAVVLLLVWWLNLINIEKC